MSVFSNEKKFAGNDSNENEWSCSVVIKVRSSGRRNNCYRYMREHLKGSSIRRAYSFENVYFSVDALGLYV